MAGFFSRIFQKWSTAKTPDWDEVESDLVMSDIGVSLSLKLLSDLQKDPNISTDELSLKIQRKLGDLLPVAPLEPKIRPDGKPSILLVVGVNGTGKTTSSAKLAHYLTKKGHSVLLVAADTFRAAAVEQLESWAHRLNIPLYKGRPNQDPSSVCYEAHTQALRDGVEFVICDTAGRLHTRHNLMSELAKIKKTLAKQDDSAPHTTYLVVDATTGANALAQAKEFHKATPLDALIVTKLDGSGKGGVSIAIQHELDIPTSFIGLGEGPDDFMLFDKEYFLENIL